MSNETVTEPFRLVSISSVPLGQHHLKLSPLDLDSHPNFYQNNHLPGGSDGKESAHNEENLGLIPGLGRSPGGGHGNSLQYSYLENPHGRRSLVGYSPWSYKELYTTEQLSTEAA